MNALTQSASLEELAAVFGYPLKRRPLRPTEASELTGLAVATLQDMRHDGTGPRYFRRARFVYYAERDLLEWLVAGARRNTSESLAA
jgi:predicted DNA-binding transcriptional regulator AlpA